MTIHIKPTVQQFIVDQFLFGEAEELDDHASFIETGIVDSTGILELVSFIEETFGIVLDDGELIPENLDSLDNLSRFLSAKLDNGK